MENQQTYYRGRNDRGDNTGTGPKPMSRRRSLSLNQIAAGSEETRKWKSNSSDTGALLGQRSKLSVEAVVEAVGSSEHESDDQMIQRIQRIQRIREWQAAVSYGVSQDHSIASQPPEGSDTEQRSDQRNNDLKHVFDEMCKADEVYDREGVLYRLKISYEVLMVHRIVCEKIDYIIENNMKNSKDAYEVIETSKKLGKISSIISGNERYQKGNSSRDFRRITGNFEHKYLKINILPFQALKSVVTATRCCILKQHNVRYAT